MGKVKWNRFYILKNCWLTRPGNLDWYYNYSNTDTCKTKHHKQGRNEGVARGVQFSGRRVAMGTPNHCGCRMVAGGAKKSQQCHKYFLQYSTFASERPQFRTRGAKLASCPGRHLTWLRPWSQNHESRARSAASSKACSKARAFNCLLGGGLWQDDINCSP